MKNGLNRFILLLLTSVLLLLCAAAGLCAEEKTPVFWQLTAVERTLSDDYAYGSASAETDVEALSSGDLSRMADSVRGTHSVRLSLSRETREGLKTGEALYTLSGVPVVIPGPGAAKLTVTANTTADARPFYLYAIVRGDGRYVMRVRKTGSWVCKICFPRLAVPGETRNITLKARELYGEPEVLLTYTYTAVAGSVLFSEGEKTAVLRDGQDREIATLGESLTDLLAAYSEDTGDSVVFSAERAERGPGPFENRNRRGRQRGRPLLPRYGPSDRRNPADDPRCAGGRPER